MRTLDTEGLTSLGASGHGPWRLEGNRLLRTSRAKVPFFTAEDARKVFDAYAAARAAGVDAPRPLEIVRVRGGYGVVVEFVRGLNFGTHVFLGSYDLEEAGRELGAFAKSLHATQAHDGCDWNATFRAWARTMATYLPRDSADKLVELVCAIPESNTFLHGDLHMANVIVHGGHLALIDMESAGFGHPTLELAVMRTRTILGVPREGERHGVDCEAGRKAAEVIWRAELAGYFGSADEMSDLDMRLRVLSEIESCCYGNEIHGADPSRLTASQRERVAVARERICPLLPQIERLDF